MSAPSRAGGVSATWVVRSARQVLWIAGLPARAALIGLIGVYRLTLGGMLGGQCRFYPSCSAYAIESIRSRGAVVGSLLGAWRLLRCSPLSRGGVDLPPARSDARAADSSVYEDIIQRGEEVLP